MGIGAVDEAIAVVVGAGLLLGGAGAASASTISFGPQTFSVQQSTTPSQTLDFDQFSPSLGTLYEVDILLTGSTIGGGATANLTGGEGGIAISSFTATLDVVGPGATNALSGALSASATCQNNFTLPYTCSSGLIAPTLGVGAFTPNPALITTSLTPFVGTGTLDLVTDIASFTPVSSCTNASNATCNNTSDVSWLGSLTVTYLYTPNNAVPEPGGLGVLAAGLVGLGLLERLRRRSREAHACRTSLKIT